MLKTLNMALAGRPVGFRRSLWIGTLKRVNMEKMCCPVDFSEEFIAVFQVEMSQIDTKNDKNPEVFQCFMHFFQNFMQKF